VEALAGAVGFAAGFDPGFNPDFTAVVLRAGVFEFAAEAVDPVPRTMRALKASFTYARGPTMLVLIARFLFNESTFVFGFFAEPNEAQFRM
jgi:hypothetical protein